MNYHVEHHMFPMVPYHALPRLHELIKHDLPAPTPSIVGGLPRDVAGASPPARATRTTISAASCRRPRGPTARTSTPRAARDAAEARPRRRRPEERPMAEWVDACATDEIDEEDVMRWDHGGRTYAIYRSPDGEFFATDGLCTPRERPPRGRAGDGPRDRVPQAQRPVRLPHRRGPARAGLRQPRAPTRSRPRAAASSSRWSA